MPPRLLDYGARKFTRAELIGSSEGRRWFGVGAELRRHGQGAIVPAPPTQMEVTLAVRGSATSVVHRRAGRTQRTVAESGSLWFCPIDVQEDEIWISDTIPEVLHVYLPRDQFDGLVERDGAAAVPASAVPYLAGMDDPLIRHIGLRLLDELRNESGGGSLLAEALGTALATHIICTYSSAAGAGNVADRHHGGLDARRLARVTEFMRDHLDQDLTIADLAGVACLSRHHFMRSFRKTVGVPPHRYIGNLRIDAAKTLLKETDTPIVQIALSCRFSSQSAFGRAFAKRVGGSPAEYRRAHRGSRVGASARH